MKNSFWPLTILILMVFASCFKEDEAVQPHQRGAVITTYIPLGSAYNRQVYFKMADSSIVMDIDRYTWDIAFGGAPINFHIRPNSSRFMMVYATHSTKFDSVYEPANYNASFDASSGNPDSLVFNDWFASGAGGNLSTGKVFLLDAGLDKEGKPLPVWRLQFEWIDSTSIGLHFALNDERQGNYAEIAIDSSRNYTGFSLAQETSVICEPVKTEWDLYFGQYSTMLYTSEGVPTPYLVTGALLNPNNTSAIDDLPYAFSDISLDDAQSLLFSNQNDIIGYDWKYYDLEAGTYSVNSEKTYLLKDQDAYIYVMRFIGFSSPDGERGWPVFEYQRL